MRPETPEPDAAEQQRQAFDEVDSEEIIVPSGINANPADAADQQRDVPDDEDDAPG